MKLLLATTNPAKLRAMKFVFSGRGFDVVGLSELEDIPEVQETGNTFEENAVLKASGHARALGLPTVADDGGLEIEALGGEPGIYSRRWPGYAASDEELITHAMERLANIPEGRRQACFHTVVAFADLQGNIIATQEAVLPGIIAKDVHPRRDPGYPYRSIFFLPELGKYAIDFTPEEDERVSHRHRALNALLPYIQKHFLQ